MYLHKSILLCLKAVSWLHHKLLGTQLPFYDLSLLLSIGLLQMRSDGRENHSVSFLVYMSWAAWVVIWVVLSFLLQLIIIYKTEIIFIIIYYNLYLEDTLKSYMFSEEKMSVGKNLGIHFSFPDILECFFQPQWLCLINCRSVPFLCGILLFSRAVSVVLYLFVLSALLVQDGTFCRELDCFTECFIFIYLHICLYMPLTHALWTVFTANRRTWSGKLRITTHFLHSFFISRDQ